jgi:serine/threonine protein kinase
MNYLHRFNIIHRDLKPDNILLDGNLQPFIGDFGLSKQADARRSVQMSAVVGTPIYMAPELYEMTRYSSKVDVYAFALIVYEVIGGREPFGDVTNAAPIAIRVAAGHRPDLHSGIPKPFRRLISDCWAQNPGDRPSFDEIIDRLRSDDFSFPKLVDADAVQEYASRVLSTGYLFRAERRLAAENGRLNERIEKLEASVRRLKAQHREMLKRLDELVRKPPKDKWISFGSQKGILSFMAESPERKVVLSLSSNNPFQLIHPSADGCFVAGDDGPDNWIEFEFPEAARIQSVRIIAGEGHFLKSWRLVSSKKDVRVVLYAVDADDELNKSYAEKVLTFEPVLASRFRIEQTSPCWDDRNCFALKSVEFRPARPQTSIF